MNLLIVAATPFEIAPLYTYLEEHFTKTSAIIFTKDKLRIHVLVTGVGLTHTAYAMGRYIGSSPINLAINVGIAGAFDKTLKLGEVVHITEDFFGDLGIEHADGTFKTLFEEGLMEANHPPFSEGELRNSAGTNTSFLPKVKGCSVHTVQGSEASITAFKQRNPSVQIESMEGAAFSFVCLQEKIPFLQIRSISNYVEKRDKSKWNIPLAIQNLNAVAIDMIQSMEQEIS